MPFANKISIRWLLPALFVWLLPAGSCFAHTIISAGGLFDLPIPANPNSSAGSMQDAVINVTSSALIGDLNVSINLTHSRVFDLQIELQSPAGTVLCLNSYDDFTNDFFFGADYVDTVFDDQAPLSIQQADVPFTGSFRPLGDGGLGVFNGENTLGEWKLKIVDRFKADTGRLEEFRLFITAPEPAMITFFSLGMAIVILLRPKYSL